jgi:cell division protein FtsI/penicillin-binding protein 2
MSTLRTITAGVVVLALPVLILRTRARADEARGGHAEHREVTEAKATPAAAKILPPFSGIELDNWEIRDEDVVAPAPPGRTARLTLDPELQRATERILSDYEPLEAGVVVIDTATGHVKVWANHVEHGPDRDICAEATAPAASIFKIVTAAALLETAGLSPDTKQCYSGGESRITAQDLVDNPKRDVACATLGEALGRSLNTVFARLAVKHLSERDLGKMAEAFGFGRSIPFDLTIAESTLALPKDALGFGRTAAGFWNTTLSPFVAANMANIIANHGEVVRPVLVESVVDASGPLYRAPSRGASRRAIRAETAAALTSMMETTVKVGTSARAFRDNQGRPFLPNIAVAGKTGTLSSPDGKQFYTWFVGFAPSNAPEIALAVLVVNQPTYKAKANVVARDVLRVHFASVGARGVSRPPNVAQP